MWKVLKCDAGKDYKDQLDCSCEKRRSVKKSRGVKYPADSKTGRLTGLVISCVGTALYTTLLKEVKREG